jgi:hypothetical protein
MRSMTTRQLVFGLMIVAVGICATVYAGNSAPWAGASFAGAAISSTPAKPEIASGPLTDPDTLHVVWGPSAIDPLPAPQWYSVTVENTTIPSTTSTSWPPVEPLTPGSSHDATVVAFAFGNPSVPATITIRLPKAPVALGKPSVPSSGKTTRSIKITGKVVSAYAVGKNSVVKLKFYRHQKTKSGKWYWALAKTVTASRPTSTSYSLSLKLKPADTWTVVAETSATRSHVSDRSARSSSIKIK